MLLVFKASLVGLAVYLSTLAGRRWGHKLAGWIAGLPIIAGPICAFMAYDLGSAFVQKTAIATLQVIPAIGVFCLTYALLARTGKWWLCLGSAYVTYWLSASACQQLRSPLTWFPDWLSNDVFSLPFNLQIASALAWWTWAVLGWGIALLLLPRANHVSKALLIPKTELLARITFAVVLALTIGLTAPHLGSAWSGLLLGIPISGSVLPVFTLRLHGVASTYQVIRGFLLGIFSFVTFFAVLATGAGEYHTFTVFVIGVISALLSARFLALMMRLASRHRHQSA